MDSVGGLAKILMGQFRDSYLVPRVFKGSPEKSVFNRSGPQTAETTQIPQTPQNK
jgi:hypothetical protein